MQGIIPFPRQALHFTSDDLPIHAISPVCHGSDQPPIFPSIDAHLFEQRMRKRTFDQEQQSATAENQRDPKYSRIAPLMPEDPLLNKARGLIVSRGLTTPTHINQRELEKQCAVMYWLRETTIKTEVECFISKYKRPEYYRCRIRNILKRVEKLYGIGMDAPILSLMQKNSQELCKNILDRNKRRIGKIFYNFISHLYQASARPIGQEFDPWRLESAPMQMLFDKQPDPGSLTQSQLKLFGTSLRNVSEVSYWIAETILHSAQSIYEGARKGNVEKLERYALPQLHLRLPIQAFCQATIDQISWKDNTITIGTFTVVRCKPDFMKRLSTYINGRKNGYIFCDTQSEQGIVSPHDFAKYLATAGHSIGRKVDYFTLLQTAIAFADNGESLHWLDATTVGDALDKFAQIETGYLEDQKISANIRCVMGAIFDQSNIDMSPSISLRRFAQVNLGTLTQLIKTRRHTKSLHKDHSIAFNSFIRYLSQVSMGLIHEMSCSWRQNSPSMLPILSKTCEMIYPLTNTEWTQFAEALKKDFVCPSYYLIACTILHGARAIYEDYRQCFAQESESWDLPYLVDNFSLNKVLTAQIDGISFDKETITFDEHTVARFPASFMKKIQDYTQHRTGGFIFIDTEGNPIKAQGVHEAFKQASKGVYQDKTVTPLTLLETAIIVSDSAKIGELSSSLFD